MIQERGYIRSKKDTVMIALLKYATVSEASRQTGIAPATIYRYLKDENFKKEYEDKRIEMIMDSCKALQAGMSSSITELKRIIEDKEQSAQVHLNAIDMLLRHSYRMTEQCDILARIEALERG